MCQRNTLLYVSSCGKVCIINDYSYLCNVSPRQAYQRCSNRARRFLFICIFKPLQFVTSCLQNRICLPSWWIIMSLTDTDALLSEYIIFRKKFMKILHNA